MPEDTPPAHRMPMSANTHSGTALAMIEATSPGRKPTACSPWAISFDICNHCRQLVGCQTPNFFSRIAGRSPRVSSASRKLFAMVSATVSTAGLAMPVPSLTSPASDAGFDSQSPFPKQNPHLTPRFLLFPAPFAARACFLGAEIEFLNVLGMHQPLATVVHDDPADFQNIPIMRRFQRDLGVLLDQEDGHALLFVDAPDDRENFSHQDRRQAERGLVEQKQRRPVHQRAPDREHLLLAARKLPGRLVEPFPEPRKIIVNPLQILSHRLAIPTRIGAHHQVLADAQ